MIEKLMNLNYYKYKKPFSGSDCANRFKYVIQLEDFEGSSRLLATYWTKETNYRVTVDEDKTVKDFDFTDEGYTEAIKWLNDECDKSKLSNI